MTGSSHGAAAAAAAPSSQRGARVLAIVGGGFSGVCLAIHLLRQPTSRDLRIVILEPRAELGAGVAYATRDYPYPLNVAAGQMSLDAAQPDDFLEFARSQGIHATAADYLPRQVFGEYLRARFAAQVQSAPAGRRATHRRARVLQLRRADRAWELWLDDGSAMRADQVVLAVGNAPPAPLADCAALGGPHYIDDPWSIGAGAHGEPDSVLLLGSGLTMIDAALRLAAIRPRARRIHVLSRHGLLPLPQAGAGLPSLRPDLGPVLAAGSSVRRMLGALRGLGRAQTAAGGDWRELLGLLRPRLPGLWQRMDDRQRARFLRHLRAPGGTCTGIAPRWGRWPRCARSSATGFSNCMPGGSSRCGWSTAPWRPPGTRAARRGRAPGWWIASSTAPGRTRASGDIPIRWCGRCWPTASFAPMRSRSASTRRPTAA